MGRVQAVELLPYHRLGKNKYALLGRAYALESLGPMSKEDLARRAAFVAERLGGTKVLFYTRLPLKCGSLQRPLFPKTSFPENPRRVAAQNLSILAGTMLS